MITRHVTVTLTERQARIIVDLMADGNDYIIPMSSSDFRSVRALARNLRQQVARLDEEVEA